MEKIAVTPGVFVVNIPEAGWSILCGCPPDVIKHLMMRGLVHEKTVGPVKFESGPNAILLSDVPVQGGLFANMAEFPILQMFYRQGLILPGHPNNTGLKPAILGLHTQLQGVSDYLFRGTYGLANEQEIVDSGVPASLAKEIIRFKLAFAFNKVRKTEELVDLIDLDTGEASLANGVTIERLGLNNYRFAYGGETVEVDLNLPAGTAYEAPVKLEFHQINRDYFSVIHIGEGDGWDYNRPCMSSIVCFQGRIYLIDTGPNILESLTAVGISVNEIEAIFHTHAHDDHFAGLTSLARTDHRIKYYATPLVRNSIRKKLSAIMSIPEKQFARSFDVRDLRLNEWNRVEGMEVMPVLSLHPVETTFLQFRAMWEGGHRMYAHLADIATFDLMEQMLLKAPNHTEVSEKLFTFLKRQMQKPVHLKKLDVGGGMIHGSSADFVEDGSNRLVLAHIARDLTIAEKEIGSNVSFGTVDVLIPGNRDYNVERAGAYLRSYFVSLDSQELDRLLNCPIVPMNDGSIIQKRGSVAKYVYLVVTGVAEIILPKQDRPIMLSAGTLIGEKDVLSGEPFDCTYRSRSHTNLLRIPADLYLDFIQANFDLAEVRQQRERAIFLQTTYLFGEMVSSPVHDAITRQMEPQTVLSGATIAGDDQAKLVLVRSGRMELTMEETVIGEIGPMDFFGEDSIFLGGGGQIGAKALTDCEIFLIPAAALTGIPIVEWKMLEMYERRLMTYGARRH